MADVQKPGHAVSQVQHTQGNEALRQDASCNPSALLKKNELKGYSNQEDPHPRDMFASQHKAPLMTLDEESTEV